MCGEVCKERHIQAQETRTPCQHRYDACMGISAIFLAESVKLYIQMPSYQPIRGFHDIICMVMAWM